MFVPDVSDGHVSAGIQDIQSKHIEDLESEIMEIKTYKKQKHHQHKKEI